MKSKTNKFEDSMNIWYGRAKQDSIGGAITKDKVYKIIKVKNDVATLYENNWGNRDNWLVVFLERI